MDKQTNVTAPQDAKAGGQGQGADAGKDRVFKAIVQDTAQNEYTARHMRLGLEDDDSDGQHDGETGD